MTTTKTDEQIAVDGNAILIRWHDISVEGIERVELRVHALAAKEGAVHYYAVVPQDAGLPPDAIRKRMQEGLKALQASCASINLILSGTGMRAAAARSIAASIFLLSGNRKMHMFSSLDEAVVKLQPERAPLITETARLAGIV